MPGDMCHAVDLSWLVDPVNLFLDAGSSALHSSFWHFCGCALEFASHAVQFPEPSSLPCSDKTQTSAAPNPVARNYTCTGLLLIKELRLSYHKMGIQSIIGLRHDSSLVWVPEQQPSVIETADT